MPFAAGGVVGLTIVKPVKCVSVQGREQNCIEEPTDPQGPVLDFSVDATKGRNEKEDQKQVDPEADYAHTWVGGSNQAGTRNAND